MITHVELTQSNSKTALAFQVVVCSSLQITTLITQISDILQEWDNIGMLSMSSVAAGRLTRSARHPIQHVSSLVGVQFWKE